MYNRYFREWVNKNIPNHRTVIYGYGDLGKSLWKMLEDMGCEVLFFIDDLRTDENCYKLKNAPIIDEPIIIGVNPNKKKIIKDIVKRCLDKGYNQIKILDLFFVQILEQVYRVPPPEYAHYIQKSLKFFEPNCFKEFLLRNYPYNIKNRTQSMLEKGYPYDLNVKFQTLSKIENLYFYNDVQIEKNDIVVDAGVSCGWEQQITNFAKYTDKMVYGFEPNEKSFQQILEETKNLKNVKIFNYGLGDDNNFHFFVDNGGGSKIVSYETDIKIKTVKLDDILEEVNYIKMDIEGWELKALKGAENLIKTFKPKLAICLYHKYEDIYEIPKYIKKIEPNYKLWIVCNEGFLWAGIKMFGIYKNK